MELVGGFGFSPFAPAVIARCGGDIGMAGHLLHGHDIDVSIEQIPDKGAPQVMRGEMEDSCFEGALLQDEIDRLIGHAARHNRPVFADRAKERG
jgi:hypothetical protein